MAGITAELTELAEGNRRRVRAALWPSPDAVDAGLRGPLPAAGSVRACAPATFPGRLEDRKFVDVIADVLRRRMETDARVIVLGEDVHRMKGGTNGATRGLKERFPDRVLGTPISENAFFGLGAGLAMDGRLRPIVEFMYPDFMWVAADQIFNQAGKARHMFGGNLGVPLVLRTKVAVGTGYGSQHSMDPAGIFATSAGWRIVAPSTPFDYVGLMNAALAGSDPVLILEHVDLYGATMPAPVDDLDYVVPLGSAAVRRAGERVTVLAYLGMVRHALEAVERLGLDAEVIDLRTLDRAGLDWEAIGESLRKTNRLLIAEQGPLGTSWGAWVADEAQRRFFDWLDAPIERVTGSESSPTISKVLEDAAIARADAVVAGLRRVLA
jgi:2-oxoisovalerate dehydrogenase E1 component